MRRKLVSLLTVTAIMLSMLAGCSKQAETPAKQDSGTEVAGGQASVQKAGSSAQTNMAEKKVGICIYQFDDNFMSLFKDELVSYLEGQGFSPDNIAVYDSQGSQDTQNQQIQEMISNNVDVMIINAVNSSSAAGITDMAVGSGTPLVYINREPDAAEEQRWMDNNWDVTYVGCDARQSGTLQGDIIVDLGMETVDLNQDGVIQYAMIKGDPENIDAQYRTEFSIKALEDAGWQVECLYKETADWEKDKATTLVAEALASHPEIEVVFCNNDAMALGALESIQAAGRTVGTDIFLVGVDALTEALDGVLMGTITGTVFNDYFDQSHRAGDAAVNYVRGNGNDHYIGCDYVKVVADNAQQILDSIR